MNQQKYFIIFCALVLLSGNVYSQKKNPEIKISVESKYPAAPLMVAVNKKCNPFPNDSAAVKLIHVKPNNKKAVLQLNDLSYGDYAIAVYQDLNEDGKLNYGKFNVPREPYGFSNNFRPNPKRPTFEICKFSYNEIQYKVEIKVH